VDEIRARHGTLSEYDHDRREIIKPTRSTRRPVRVPCSWACSRGLAQLRRRVRWSL